MVPIRMCTRSEVWLPNLCSIGTQKQSTARRWETEVLKALSLSPAKAMASTVQRMTVQESRMKRTLEPVASMLMHSP